MFLMLCKEKRGKYRSTTSARIYNFNLICIFLEVLPQLNPFGLGAFTFYIYLSEDPAWILKKQTMF